MENLVQMLASNFQHLHLVNIFVLCVCVFSSGFPLRRCASGPPSLGLKPHDMECNRHATFSAVDLCNYNWDYSESPEDLDSPCTSPKQISMFVGSQDNSESWIQQDFYRVYSGVLPRFHFFFSPSLTNNTCLISQVHLKLDHIKMSCKIINKYEQNGNICVKKKNNK